MRRGLLIRSAAVLLLLAGVVYAATATLYPTTNATSASGVTSPTNAYANDNTGALVNPNNSYLTVAGFNNTNLGTISDVTVWVKYRTSATPGNDSYQFDAAIDGSTFTQTIVAANTTDQPSYVTASLSLGALTWAQVGTLAIRCLTTRQGGLDGYSVDWDVGYVVVTYSTGNVAPSVSITNPGNGSSIGGPAASYSISGTASDSDGTVSSVQVQIQRGTDYWNGSTWTTTATWLTATGTTSWSYSWSWTSDMDATSVTVRARATDNGGAQTTATNTTTVDTRAPQVATGVRFQTLPTSGDASFTLLSNWTEANPGTPRFAYNLNNTGYTSFVNGSAGNASSRTYAVALTGSDYFTGIKSDHTDTFSNGPTTSEDPGPFYVLPLTPSAPTVGSPTTNSLAVTIVPNAGEGGTGMLYAIRCHDAGGAPTGFWVAQTGRQCTAAAADWQALATWGTPVTVGGLGASTTYQFSVAAGNPKDATPTTGERSASAYSGTGSGTTSAGNTPPTVSITAPTNGASYNQGATVTFTGTASDAEDGTLTASLAWTSSINGSIGTGGSFTRSDLSVGTHTITASVTDSGSLTGQAQVTITINATAVTPGTPSAIANGCDQVTVSAPFTGDGDADSTTDFRRGTAPGGPFNTDVCIGVTGASPRTCIDTTVSASTTYYYQVDFTDPDGVNGTDPQVTSVATPACAVNDTTVSGSSAVASSCNQITVTSPFTGDANGNGSINVQYNTTNSFPATVACASVSGPSPRQCLVTGLSGSTGYYVQVAWTDADGVTGTNPEVLGPVSTPACAADTAAPTIVALSPTDDAVVGGTDAVKVQVFDLVGLRGANPVEWSVDGGGFTAVGVAVNANYSCGTGCAVYEFDWDTTALTNGPHYVSIRATDAASNVSLRSIAVVVQNTGTRASGTGTLLRRSHGSQLCIDCHNLKTHSSQSTSTKYGSWAVDCLTCHTPHRTRNLYLVREQIRTPNSGSRAVRFEGTGGAVANSAAAGAASYANEDNATQANGPCQACHTKTKNAGGQARWRNSGNLDTHYTSAAASRCTGCHTHSGGFSGAGGACNSCHNAPPSVGKHGSHDQVGTTPTDYTNTTSSATATQYGFACAKCHTGTHFSDSNKPHTVEVVFDTTAAPSNPSGSYAPDGGSQATDPGVNGDGWYWSNGTCTNLYCHSNASPVGTGASSTTATVTWNQGTALACASCHSTQARTDSGNAAHLSTSHGKHIQSTDAETGSYAFKCDECHAATIVDTPNDPWALAAADLADKREHVDGAKDVVVSTAYDGTAPGTDNYGGTSCSDTYCHSPGTTTTGPFAAPNTALAWATGASNCRSCHSGDATSAPTIATGKHTNHVNNAGVIGANYACATCHAATVSAGSNETITTLANHVNKTKDVSGTLTDNSYASPTCDNAYCHSSGQATPEYYSVNWATGGALDCKGCHGNHSSPAFTSQFGEPNYANGGGGDPLANSHKAHVTSADTCSNCHNDTTTSGTAILAGAPHTDQTRNVAIKAVFDNTPASKTDNYTPGGGTPKTCNNIVCHGVANTPQWGATLVCLNCHTGTEGGVLGDGQPNAVDDNWTSTNPNGSVGHGGLATGSGNSGPLTSARGGCDYCHQLDASHTPTSATNPYRLRFSATANDLCLRCHLAGDAGISQASDGTGLTLRNGNKNVDTAHFGTKHQTGEGGYLCWDCHDPHGVPTNILMVKGQVSQSSNTYGVPGTVVTVDFRNNSTAGQAPGRFTEATNTPRQGICQACHDPSKGTDPTTGSTKYWRNDGTDVAANPSAHNATAVCTTCHFHNANFKGAGGDCLGCHSNTGQAGTTGTNSRRPVLADFGRQSHHVGASVNAAGAALYSQPTMGGALTNFDCVVCHAEGKLVDDTKAVSECTGSGTPYACCTGSGAGTCKTTDTTGQPHQDGLIHLRNADSATSYFAYNKDQTGGINAGAAGNWNSGTQTWREWTSGVEESGGATLPAASGDLLGAGLDRFCLSCHDSNGALSTYNSGVNENRGFSGSTANPFADSNVTNEVDRLTRPGPVNIASMVAVGSCASYPGLYCRSSADCPGSTTCNVNTADESGTPRGANAVADPPDGIYSRHAIRGASSSVYAAATSLLDTTRACEVFAVGKECTVNSDCKQGGNTGTCTGIRYWEQSKYAWNSVAVMGCADCHTTDGANTTSGNAHGSGSEYLLKDAAGTAAEGTASSLNYGCYACHRSVVYTDYAFHTGSGSNDIDTTAATGQVDRTAGNGGVFGMACVNCHGGAPGNVGTHQAPTTPESATKGFGRIHGTSAILSVGTGTGTRRAYRFMNGGGLRFYDPGTWTTNSVTCYTLGGANGSPDTWSSCTQHNGGTNFTSKPVARTLNY